MSHGTSKLDLSGTGHCASFNFRRTARAVTQLFDAAFQETGIRSTQFAILVGIRKNQPVSIGALADALVLDPTTLTRSLRRLKKEGLVSISERSSRRQCFLAITPKGERVLGRSLPAWRKAQKRFVATVGTEYWTELRNELEAVAQAAVRLQEPGRDKTSESAGGTQTF